MLQRLKNIFHLFEAFVAHCWYGFPAEKLTIIGVTGTSGKTTTSHMIYHILKSCGKDVALISSVAAYIGSSSIDTGFHVTTPEPWMLAKYLHIAVEKEISYVVLEVSSHALDQNRVAFIPFKVGVLTTLAHEHLDYHKTIQNYIATKLSLLKKAEYAVLPSLLLENQTQEESKIINSAIANKKVKTFGLTSGDETLKKWKLNLKLPGQFNLLNALGAVTAVSLLVSPKTNIEHALRFFKGIPGRFEEVYSNGYRVIIDFAHKPDALDALLTAVRDEFLAKRIIVMFGCASERDVLKRPMMGEISGRLADISVLTDEDPRWESPSKIIDEIASGCLKVGASKQSEDGKWKMENGKHYYFQIPSRQEAIEFIIQKLAQKGDTILLCGKGHEKSMNYNGIERPWSEHAAVKKALKLCTS